VDAGRGPLKGGSARMSFPCSRVRSRPAAGRGRDARDLPRFAAAMSRRPRRRCASAYDPSFRDLRYSAVHRARARATLKTRPLRA